MNTFYLNSRSFYQNNIVSSINTYFYDLYGNLRQEIEDNLNSIPIVYNYSLDRESIVKQSWEQDFNGDGIVDISHTHTYDRNNNPISKSSFRNSLDFSNSNYEYTYDERGNITQTKRYDNRVTIRSFGTLSIYTYTYDANNNLITETENIFDDSYIESFITYSYDERNNLIRETLDKSKNGEIDSITNYFYDEYDNLISETIDDGGNDSINSITNYFYDEYNNLILEALDTDANGIVDERIEYDYISRAELEDLLLLDIHRFYQYEKGLHLYTSDENEIKHIQEKSSLGELAYNYEREQYQVLADNKDRFTGEVIEGVEPIYRFFNTQTGAHFYTMDENEKKSIQGNLANYNFEGIAYYAYESQPEAIETIPVYRLLNNNSGAHLFSVDINEINYLEAKLAHFVIENNGNAVFYVVEL